MKYSNKNGNDKNAFYKTKKSLENWRTISKCSVECSNYHFGDYKSDAYYYLYFSLLILFSLLLLFLQFFFSRLFFFFVLFCWTLISLHKQTEKRNFFFLNKRNRIFSDVNCPIFLTIFYIGIYFCLPHHHHHIFNILMRYVCIGTIIEIQSK